MDFPFQRQLWWACAQNDVAACERYITELRTHSEESTALEFLTHHGLVPLVAKLLETAAPTVLSDHISELALHNRRHTARMMLVVADALEALQQADITAVAYKGPVMAEQLYGHFFLRQSSDQDVLLDSKDLSRALRILGNIGFEPAWDISHVGVGSLIRCQTEFSVWRQSVCLDLHWSAMPIFSGISLQLQDCIPRLRPVTIGGLASWQFSPEDLFLILALHGTRHGWSRLIWVIDVSRILQQEALDWEYLMHRAKQLRVLDWILLAAYLAWHFAGASIPRRIERAASATRIAARAARVEHWISNPCPAREPVRAYWLTLTGRPWADGLRQVLCHLSTLGDADLSRGPAAKPLQYSRRLYRVGTRIAAGIIGK